MIQEAERETLEAWYGLPPRVRFCTRCVISNQRPGSVVEFQNRPGQKKPTIHFDDEGVCSACRYAERKQRIDWRERERRLIDLCNRHRTRTGAYDCIVPGSGGKDSSFTAHILKYKYGMNPLTVTWAPHLYTDPGWRNFQSWIGSGLDNILVSPNAKFHRLLTRLAFLNLVHPFQPFIIGQKLVAPVSRPFTASRWFSTARIRRNTGMTSRTMSGLPCRQSSTRVSPIRAASCWAAFPGPI